MAKSIEFYILKFSFWFGNLIVKGIERIVPAFKDKEENLYGFKDYYLKKFNLSNKENFKRGIKLSIKFYFSIFFWVYALLIFNNFFHFLNINFQTMLFLTISSISFLLFLLFVYIAYKVSYR